jgi:hypothetical protein
MANISTYLSDALLQHGYGKTSYTFPTTYLGLYTTAPTMPAGTGGTEVSGGSYARVALASLWGSAASESMTNSSIITFTTATASWGTVVAVGIFDALTGGNLLCAGTLTTSQVVASGNTFSVPVSNLTATLS